VVRTLALRINPGGEFALQQTESEYELKKKPMDVPLLVVTKQVKNASPTYKQCIDL
jgi:hypothetical protein